MAIRVVKLGSDRVKDEGLRLGTVRRPPRGVSKDRYSSENWYDVWLPALSPSLETMKMGKEAQSEKDWNNFTKKFLGEMKEPDKQQLLALLAAMSHQTNFSIGCYCENEAKCHRSILKEILQKLGARVI